MLLNPFHLILNGVAIFNTKARQSLLTGFGIFHIKEIKKKFCCTEENDETPRIQDLRAPVLCNPPAL